MFASSVKVSSPSRKYCSLAGSRFGSCLRGRGRARKNADRLSRTALLES